MLYGNKICDKCQSTYDANEKMCPNCGDIKNSKRSENVINLSILKQCLFVFIGYGVLQAIALFAQIVILLLLPGSLEERIEAFAIDPFYSMIVMLISYLLVAAVLLIILLNSYKVLIPHLKKYQNYLYGLLYGLALIGFSAVYGSLIPSIGNNDNQMMAESLTISYPIFSIIIIGIIGPICEEITYRLGLYSFLSRFNKIAAYIGSALIFAIIHFNFLSSNILVELINLPIYIGSGLLLSFVYDKHGLPGSLVAHITNNLISCIITIVVGASI